MYYEVKQIGDSAYPLAKHKAAVIPRSERLLFEQQVMRRPSVRFKNRNRMTYCQSDTLTPLDPTSSDGTLLFAGTPPFKLTLTIKDIAASHIETQTIEVYDHVWRLSLPSYQFKSVGPYLVTIESVADSSKCAQSALDPMFSTVWIDVAETAAIIPFERREDICMGDTVQFQLEGIPPWTVGFVTFSS
jgi:nucleoporin POM152